MAREDLFHRLVLRPVPIRRMRREVCPPELSVGTEDPRNEGRLARTPTRALGGDHTCSQFRCHGFQKDTWLTCYRTVALGFYGFSIILQKDLGPGPGQAKIHRAVPLRLPSDAASYDSPYLDRYREPPQDIGGASRPDRRASATATGMDAGGRPCVRVPGRWTGRVAPRSARRCWSEETWVSEAACVRRSGCRNPAGRNYIYPRILPTFVSLRGIRETCRRDNGHYRFGLRPRTTVRRKTTLSTTMHHQHHTCVRIVWNTTAECGWMS